MNKYPLLRRHLDESFYLKYDSMVTVSFNEGGMYEQKVQLHFTLNTKGVKVWLILMFFKYIVYIFDIS